MATYPMRNTRPRARVTPLALISLLAVVLPMLVPGQPAVAGSSAEVSSEVSFAALDTTGEGLAELAELDTTNLIMTVGGVPANPLTLVRAEDVLVYEVVTANTGDEDGTTTLTAVVPAYTTYLGVGEGWSCSLGDPAGTNCTQDVTVAAGASVTVMFTVEIFEMLPPELATMASVVTSSDGTCSSCIAVNPVSHTDPTKSDLVTSKSVTLVNGDPADDTTMVFAGDVVVYEIFTENIGGAAGETTLTDVVPDHTTYTGSGEGWSCVAGDPAGTSCTQDVTVLSDESVTLRFTVTVDDPLPLDVEEIRNLVTSSDGRCEECEVENPVGQPDLVLSKSVVSVNGDPADASTVVVASDVVSYRIEVANLGEAVGSATLTEVVPEHTTYTGVLEGWSCVAPAAAGESCEMPVMVPPETILSAAFTVTIDDPLPLDVEEIRNLVTSSDGRCEECEVETPVGHPDLVTSKSVTLVNGDPADASTVVVAGDVVVYEIVTENTGVAVGSTTLTDVVPEHTTYTGDGEGWSCVAPAAAGEACEQEVTVSAGDLVALTFTVAVDDPLPLDVEEIRNLVTSSDGRCEECEPVNPVDHPDDDAELDTVKSVITVNGEAANKTTVLRGGDVVVYRISTVNSGDADGSTTLTDIVPDNTTYTGADEGWSCTAPATAGTECSQEVNVAPGEQVALTFTVTVVDPLPAAVTSIANLVVSSDGECSDCNPTNPTETPSATEASPPPPSAAPATPLPKTGGAFDALMALGGIVMLAGAALVLGTQRSKSNRSII